MESLVSLLRGALHLDAGSLATLDGYKQHVDLDFYAALLDVCGAKAGEVKGVDAAVQQFAAIYFKNNCVPLFKKLDEMSDQAAKQQLCLLQDRLLACFVACKEEPVVELLSACVGLVARISWPTYWPNLIAQLLEALYKQGAHDLLMEKRVLTCILSIVEALASKRLPKNKQRFQELCQTVLCEQIVQVWLTDVNAFFAGMGMSRDQSETIPTQHDVAYDDSKEVLPLRMEILQLSSRIMHWVAVFGVPDLATHKSAQQFFATMLDILPELLKMRTGIATVRSLSGTVRLHLLDAISALTLKLVDTVVRFQAKHPRGFGVCLHTYLEFFWVMVTEAADEPLEPSSSSYQFEAHTALALSFFRNVTRCTEYYKDDCGQPVAQAMQAFFTQERVQNLLDLLLFRLLVLTESNCDDWVSDPEEFLLAEQQDKDGAHEHIQPAAEHLFWALFRQYSAASAPYVLNYISTLIRNESDSSSSSLEALLAAIPPQFDPRPFCSSAEDLNRALLLIKEAIYHGLCVSAQELMDCFRSLHFDFKAWYWHGLRAELQDPCAYIKRRVLLLIGDFTEAFDRDVQMDAYGVAVDCLLSEDLILATSALQMARNLTEEEDFEHGEEEEDNKQPQIYMSMLNARLGDVFSGLFHVLKRCRKVHGQQDVLDTARVFIDSAGSTGLVQNGGSTPLFVTTELGQLWGQCAIDGNGILRGSIVRTLSCLVETLGEHSIHMHEVLIPLLVDCVQVDSIHAYDHIMKELLGLLLAVVQTTPSSEELTSALEFSGEFTPNVADINAEQFHPLVVLYTNLCRLMQTGGDTVNEHMAIFNEITASFFLLANSESWFAVYAGVLEPCFHFVLDGFTQDSKQSGQFGSHTMMNEVESQSHSSVIFSEAHTQMTNALMLLAGQFPKPVISFFHSFVARLVQAVLVADPSLQLGDIPLASPGLGFDESASWMDNESQEDASIYSSILTTLMACEFPLFYSAVVLSHANDFEFDPIFGPSSALPIAVVSAEGPVSALSEADVLARRNCSQILNQLLYKFMSPWVIRNLDKQQKRFLGAGVLALFSSATPGTYALAIPPAPPSMGGRKGATLSSFPVFYLPQLFAHVLTVAKSRAKDERIGNTDFGHELKSFLAQRTQLKNHVDRITFLKLRTCTQFGDLATAFCEKLAYYRSCVEQQQQQQQQDEATAHAWALCLEDVAAVMNDLEGSAAFESLLSLRKS
jgi:hypothetical protein